MINNILLIHRNEITSITTKMQKMIANIEKFSEQFTEQFTSISKEKKNKITDFKPNVNFKFTPSHTQIYPAFCSP